jgi:hypothetical protein
LLTSVLAINAVVARTRYQSHGSYAGETSH